MFEKQKDTNKYGYMNYMICCHGKNALLVYTSSDQGVVCSVWIAGELCFEVVVLFFGKPEKTVLDTFWFSLTLIYNLMGLGGRPFHNACLSSACTCIRLRTLLSLPLRLRSSGQVSRALLSLVLL